jgi:hypothetical protein
MQSGAIAFEIAPYVAGTALATASAQASPATTARSSGCLSERDRIEMNVPDICSSYRHCEERSDEAIQTISADAC